MVPAGIEPATFRFVAQRLNHRATAVPGFFDTFLFLKKFLYHKMFILGSCYSFLQVSFFIVIFSKYKCQIFKIFHSFKFCNFFFILKFCTLFCFQTFLPFHHHIFHLSSVYLQSELSGDVFPTSKKTVFLFLLHFISPN